MSSHARDVLFDAVVTNAYVAKYAIRYGAVRTPFRARRRSPLPNCLCRNHGLPLQVRRNVRCSRVTAAWPPSCARVRDGRDRLVATWQAGSADKAERAWQPGRLRSDG